MSAPALNVEFDPTRTTPSIPSSAAARSSDESMSRRNENPKLFTGGDWKAITAIRPRVE
jgi:hypothetical protein